MRLFNLKVLFEANVIKGWINDKAPIFYEWLFHKSTLKLQNLANLPKKFCESPRRTQGLSQKYQMHHWFQIKVKMFRFNLSTFYPNFYSVIVKLKLNKNNPLFWDQSVLSKKMKRLVLKQQIFCNAWLILRIYASSAKKKPDRTFFQPDLFVDRGLVAMRPF